MGAKALKRELGMDVGWICDANQLLGYGPAAKKGNKPKTDNDGSGATEEEWGL
jgi:hypothetical protein